MERWVDSRISRMMMIMSLTSMTQTLRTRIRIGITIIFKINSRVHLISSTKARILFLRMSASWRIYCLNWISRARDCSTGSISWVLRCSSILRCRRMICFMRRFVCSISVLRCQTRKDSLRRLSLGRSWYSIRRHTRIRVSVNMIMLKVLLRRYKQTRSTDINYLS